MPFFNLYDDIQITQVWRSANGLFDGDSYPAPPDVRRERGDLYFSHTAAAFLLRKSRS